MLKMVDAWSRFTRYYKKKLPCVLYTIELFGWIMDLCLKKKFSYENLRLYVTHILPYYSFGKLFTSFINCERKCLQGKYCNLSFYTSMGELRSPFSLVWNKTKVYYTGTVLRRNKKFEIIRRQFFVIIYFWVHLTVKCVIIMIRIVYKSVRTSSLCIIVTSTYIWKLTETYTSF